MRSNFPFGYNNRLIVLVALLLGCGPVQSTAPPPRAAQSAAIAADGGLPAPAPSTAKGVIVPDDTGVGATPSGSGTTTGTTGGGSVDKAIGNTPTGGN